MLTLGIKRGIRKRIRKFLERYPGRYEEARRDARNWLLGWWRAMYEREPSGEILDELERYMNEVLMSVRS